jgi:hypothetical protein
VTFDATGVSFLGGPHMSLESLAPECDALSG